MPFPLNVRLAALIACQRHCCLCNQRKHTRLQCHHIIPEADDGPDTLDNCIPLCPDCHAEVMAYNPKHPFGGTPYHPQELRRRRDDWYSVIQQRTQRLVTILHRKNGPCPHNPSVIGTAQFDYSHYDGFYRIGEGNNEFLTQWSKASNRAIHCYRDATNCSVALVPLSVPLSGVSDASQLHFESRVQTPQLGQFVVLENHAGRYAALKVMKILDCTRGDLIDELTFHYWILQDGEDDFSNISA